MTGSHLLGLYLAVGAAAALLVARRAEGSVLQRASSACVAWLLWPLWAPIALGPADRARAASVVDPRTAQLHAALDAAIAAAAGSPFEALLSSDAALRVRREIDRAGARIAELDATLRRPGFDPAAADARLSELERTGASPRAIANAHLHRDAVARLARTIEQDRRALGELGDAIDALRSQIVLARVTAPGGDGEIAADLWARVEALGAVFDPGEAASEENRSSDVVESGQEARA